MRFAIVKSLVILLFLLPCALADIYTDNGNIYNRMQVAPFPQITSMEGMSWQLIFFFNLIEDNLYDIRICHRDFETNKGTPSLKEYTITSPNINQIVNLADNECQSFTAPINEGDIINFDDEMFAQSEVGDILLEMPEIVMCDGQCNAQIKLTNKGKIDFNFPTDSLWAMLEDGTPITLTTEKDYIGLQPETSITYDFTADVTGESLMGVIFFVDSKEFRTDTLLQPTSTPPPPVLEDVGQKVTENGITIESDKHDYYCEADANGECLIVAEITITYDTPEPQPQMAVLTEFSTPVDKILFQDMTITENDVATKKQTESKQVELPSITDGMVSIASTEKFDINPENKITMPIEFKVSGSGKFNVIVDDGNAKVVLDPYYWTTNTTPPRAEWNQPMGQAYPIGTIINLSADALDYYNISSVVFQIETPNGIKTNVSASTQPEWWSLRDENESTGTFTNNFATYFGDFNTNYVKNGMVLFHFPKNTNINRIALEMNSITGNPQLQNFIYNITICETNVQNLTSSANRSIDCTSPLYTMAENIDLSQQIGTLNLNNFALLKLNRNFTTDSTKKYIISFDHVSGIVNGASDFWTVRVQSFTNPLLHYGRITNTSALFFSNVFINMRLFSDYTYTYATTTQSGRYNLTMFATDFHGNTNITTTFFTITQSCNWTAQYGFCLTNDTQLKYYTETNGCNSTDGLPVDNGTYIPCNYCSEDLQKSYTTNCYNLNGSGVRQYTWQDDNYYSCCAITGSPSDCSILTSPYNETGYENCTLLTEDFSVSYDDNCDMGIGFDRCYWTVNLNITNSTFNCITYVKTNMSKLIQSNPVYTQKSDAIIQFKGTDYEDRNYFIIQNGIGSVYFTKENLIFDGRTYIFGVQCADNNQVLTTEKLILLGYENLNSPINRGVWSITQMPAIIFLIIGIVIILFVFAIVWGIHKVNMGR